MFYKHFSQKYVKLLLITRNVKTIVLIGMMGSGKLVGKELAKKLNVTFIDIDQEIEKKYQKNISKFFELAERVSSEKLKKMCHVN